MRAADTNLFLYAANPASDHHVFRNPAVMKKALTSKEAAGFCLTLRQHPHWQHVDYCPEVSDSLWDWAASTTSAFRRVIDARLALTLLHHGVMEFATANTKEFQTFGFLKVWNPLE